MRVCPNVPGQHAIPVALAEDSPWTDAEVIDPGGRIERQLALTAERLNAIPGVSCVAPRGALYCFPRVDRDLFGVESDEELVLDLLRQEHILVTHGTGFNWPEPDHFRIVCLPDAGVLDRALGAIGGYLGRRAQSTAGGR